MSIYERQIGIFGEEGQKRICECHVAVAGCGGLGCFVINDLALAGIRHFTIIDCDEISESNYNRQFIYLGKKGRKIQIMKDWVTSNFEGSSVDVIDARLCSENIDDFLDGADVAVDCLDNNESRIILNDGIMSKKIPLVHGGVESMFGQVTVVIPGKTPCLGCILNKGTSGNKPSVSASVSMIASLQASEVLKIITGKGEPLAGKLMTIDLLTNDVQVIPLGRKVGCTHCR